MAESQRQLAAIMFTDIVGYTALMGKDSEKALNIVRINSELQKEVIARHNGIWLKEMGDGVLAKFGTAQDSVKCAIEIQKIARSELDAKLRIGIHLGDVTIQSNDVYGDGVNVAARLQSIADPGGIYISDAIHKAIQGNSDINYTFLGEVDLKNVSYQIGVYAIQGIGLPLVEPNKFIQTTFLNELQNGGIILTGFIYLILSAIILFVVDSTIIIDGSKSYVYLIGIVMAFPIVVFFAWRMEKDSKRTKEKQRSRNQIKKNIIISGLGLIILILYTQNQYPSTESSKEGMIEIKDKSIAVLPFTNMSNDENQQYFSDGMMEDILNHLSKISELKVISRTSSEMYRDRQGKSLPVIASELGVAYILEGSVQKDQNIARIIVQLIKADEDKHVWSDNYDREMKEIFKTQTEISKIIADALLIKLFPSEERLLNQQPTNNISAYDLFLHGRNSLNISRDFVDSDENETAITYFKGALSQDEKFAIAKAGLGQAFLDKVLLFGQSSYWIDSALILANDAVELDSNLVEVHLLKGAIYRIQGLERESITSYQKALDLNPNSAESYNFLATLSKEDKSTRNLNYQFKAIELDPLNPNRHRSISNVLKNLGTPIDTQVYQYDQLFPIIVPESNKITIGSNYNAEIFLVAGSSDLNPKIYVDGKTLTVKKKYFGQGNEVAFGDLKFNVTGGGQVVLGENYRKKTYDVDITLGDKVFTKEVEYFVTAPNISVTSRSVSTLWKNCSNELTVLIPEMIDGYSPKIIASNAQVIQGVGGSVSLIPDRQRDVIMSILNLGDTLGSFRFRVKRIPNPSIEMRIGGRIINLQDGILSSQIRGNLTIEALPDESFAIEAPLDARYRIVEANVILATNKDARVRVTGGSVIQLNQIMVAAPRRGEILVVMINKLSRINYKEEIEELSVRELGLVFAIQIK